MNDCNEQFDQRLWKILPHRPPMLLINKIISVEKNQSQAMVFIDENSPFFKKGQGISASIGLEYMGQTAALIAGYEVLQGKATEPHLGYLLGMRKYESTTAYFKVGRVLIVECKEEAVVGESLARFNCTIRYQHCEEIIVTASLSVLRKKSA
jgi:predicted hotdog family 3-hydroxylacyl-ACP dehydratase